MYIPTWLIILVICVGIWYYFFKSKKNTIINDDGLTTVEEMWQSAESWKERVQEKSPLSGLEEIGSFDNEREMVRAMETDSIRLRERFKHDPEKQKHIARDWMDYANAVQEIKSEREMLDVDWTEGAYDRYDENTKESYAVIYEVAKRVAEELGDASYSKAVHDKLRKQAEAANEALFKADKSENTEYWDNVFKKLEGEEARWKRNEIPDEEVKKEIDCYSNAFVRSTGEYIIDPYTLFEPMYALLKSGKYTNGESLSIDENTDESYRDFIKNRAIVRNLEKLAVLIALDEKNQTKTNIRYNANFKLTTTDLDKIAEIVFNGKDYRKEFFEERLAENKLRGIFIVSGK